MQQLHDALICACVGGRACTCACVGVSVYINLFACISVYCMYMCTCPVINMRLYYSISSSACMHVTSLIMLAYYALRKPVCLPVARPYILHLTHVCGCVHFYLYARSMGTPQIAKNFTPSLSPVKVPGLCFSVYSECDWLQCVLSECCWLASSLTTVCYRSSVSTLLSGLVAREGALGS